MSRFIIALVLFSVALIGNSQAQVSEDSLAIKQAAMDYIEGWYDGNAERMEKALHPELAKRVVFTDTKSGRSRLSQMSAMTLVQYTRYGGGKDTPVDEQRKDYFLLDVFQNTACAKVIAKDWVDYMQLAKYNGEWKIVNVLWEMEQK